MLKLLKISKTYNMEVFTESGDFFGAVDEAIITNNKIHGWRVSTAKNSILKRLLGNAKGVIVPHNLTKAIGDIMIVQDNVLHSNEED